MKKLLVLLVLMLSLGVALNDALAQESASTSTDAAVVQEAQVTAADLGVSDPGMLPTSRIYFLKNWGRSIKRTFTFNPVKKAELELDIANQQAAEIAKMKETLIGDPDFDLLNLSILKASQNYQANVDRLKNRLEALKDTSQNPNVDKLMEKLADRSVKHQQLFDELKQKFEDKPELKQRFVKMQDKMNEALIKIPEKFDSPEAFKNRMKRVIEARPDSPSKELRGMEMMEKIKEKLPEDRRAGFEGVKDELMKKFEERISAMPESAQKTFMVPHMLERMKTLPPGDPDFDLKMKILEDVKGRVLMPPAMREKMESTQSQILEKAAEKGELGKEKAEEQMRGAQKAISELESRLARYITEPDFEPEPDYKITQMKNLLAQAKRHFDNAKTALGAGKYGEAFGQATSAEMIARNALKGNVLFKTQPPAPVPLPGTRPLPAGSALPPPSGTSTTVLPPPPTGIKPPLSGGQIVCTTEYLPVCGVDGKTYSNKCHAQNAGIVIKTPGVCRSVESAPAPTSTR